MSILLEQIFSSSNGIDQPNWSLWGFKKGSDFIKSSDEEFVEGEWWAVSFLVNLDLGVIPGELDSAFVIGRGDHCDELCGAPDKPVDIVRWIEIALDQFSVPGSPLEHRDEPCTVEIVGDFGCADQGVVVVAFTNPSADPSVVEDVIAEVKLEIGSAPRVPVLFVSFDANGKVIFLVLDLNVSICLMKNLKQLRAVLLAL